MNGLSSLLIAGVWCALAYLVGSISFAIVLSKWFGMDDPRSYGSNNPGATNMLRSGRKEVALLTLLGDALKGFLPVYLAARWGEMGMVGLAWVALFAFLGHLYPIYFKFVGGKGVATFLGVVLGLSANIGLWVILVWIVLAVVFRYSSLASLGASVVALVLFVFDWGMGWALLPMALMVGLMFYRHRENIVKLRAGQERKLFAPKQ
ncbi:MAG: glycerol-3-phosphate 1-O-acyltransferase PlsY [Burkholderiales bacterium]|nr:glycerol-3-phosphate 1-O-acyltransferase PlsY [Burkholderiales bacterium]